MRSAVAISTIGLLVCVAMGCSAMARDDLFQSDGNAKHTWTALERSTLTTAEVNWANASAPFKKYLLIEDGDFLCAIRFVNYQRGRDASPGSVWSSGEETLTSAYEWNILQRERDIVRVVEQGKDIVQRTPLTGIGRFVVAGGYGNVSCGSRKFGWQYPAGINFSRKVGSQMKLAPTRWEKIEDIRLNDPKLIWYSFDQNRKDVYIPIARVGWASFSSPLSR